jgi:hypothetical protein
MIKLGILVVICSLGCGDDGAMTSSGVDAAVQEDAGATTGALTLMGTACSTPISAGFPQGKIYLAVTGGALLGIVVADGTPFDAEDEAALATYTANHDVYTVFGLDDPTTLQVGTYDTIFDSLIFARGVGVIGLAEGDSASVLEIVALDQSAQTIELTFSFPVSGFDDSYPPVLDEFDVCNAGVVTGTIKGDFLWLI